MPDKETRKGHLPIKVYCLPDEHAQIQTKANATGLSLSTYLRRVGMGYEIKSILDYRCVHDLARINGDQGRLGGLLKLWLTKDSRAADLSLTTVRVVLKKIETLQDELRKVMKRVVNK